ncbi:MAG: 1-(5-phosphoribosyl)-5-amino-4-imidazole-carboxylate carboxylase, partial [Sedimentisphaerales bacterium]|nr:1-(5-phosphoribosyl)-5-amino-4-imidazole-carboxylate carboxylase [Sedimentisphaerales bacterium]
MDTKILKQLLEDVKTGDATVETALKKLRSLPFESLEYAHLDHHRAIRCGMPEVIYCPGKTTEQIVEIFSRLAQQKNNVLAT